MWNVSKVEFKGVTLTLDRDGFLQEPEKWNKEVAAFLAKEQEGIKAMSESHWKVVNYLREYYLQYQIAPPIRMLCKRTGFTVQQIYELFPSGPAKGACKVAGLPKPTGCV